MKRSYLIGTLIFVLFMVLIVVVALALHLDGIRLILFVGVMALVGVGAIIAVIMMRRKEATLHDPAEPQTADTVNLDALVRSAEARLKASPGGAKSLAGIPLVYVLGDENSAKTQTILQSGLDAELLAGEVYRDNLVAPTQLANIWYTGSGAMVEAGSPLLRQPALWRRLIRLTQPHKLTTALKRGGLQPTRAAVLCISIERLTTATSPDAIRILGQTLNERLRLLSETLGISLPVYVLFTKLDTIPSFADYAANLTEEEVRQPLGALLARIDAGAGLYSERATQQTAARFDELAYSLSEFRTEILSRGNQPESNARSYEFPRELRKLRALIVDFLVEAGRPSRLGVNPFLRGFYFSGIRAHVIEEMSAPSVAPATPPAAQDAGATRIFSFNAATMPAAQPQAPQRTTRRVPQWVFLPHLLPRIVMADRSALDTSRASTKVNLVKRALIIGAASCLALYLICLTISYAKNAALEDRLRAAASMSTQSVSHGDLASLTDLQNLEKLRVVFAQIADYQQNGAPLFYKFGLYPGDKLYATACSAYGNRFRTLLLSPTQANLVQTFATLPPDRRPTDEYTATYRPLRAYLISTSNPEKSSSDTAGDLEKAWVGSNTLPTAATDLSTAQFQTYTATLPLPNSCMAQLGGAPRMPVVQQARSFLSHFQGIEQVYISMKAAADRKFRSIRFNDLYPGSAAYVVDSYEVEGAFTKGGYSFMQDAILHPEPYTSGEEWVLGPATGPGVERVQLNAQLPPRYLTDFLNAWRSYLKAAHIVNGGSFPEAQKKIHALSGPGSPMTELFQLISDNTTVANDAFSKPFQAPQSVVPPKGTALPQGYVTGLGGLDTALSSLGAPGTTPSGAALSAIDTAATAARSAVNAVRSGFVPPDPAGGMDTTSEAILLAPIKNAEDLSGAGKAAAAGGGAKALCAQVDALTKKFPFSPDSHEDATPAEVAAVFGPGQGAIAQFAQTQTSNITLLGQRYIQAQGSNVAINPGFLNFMNAAQTITATFFPTTKLDFSLTQEAVKNLPPATVDIDGNKLDSAGPAKSFTWISAPTGKVHVTAGQQTSPDYTGPWSLFHFAYGAKHPAANKLEFIFAMNGQTVNSQSGVPLDFTFDVGGPGAAMLNPAFMHQLHCTIKVATK
ncbi:ImcF-related family protein [Granulicella paludicola]|uniref:ImcF-related family protein n=1 Tax=Granulicella paludicola TaxID=474951 RepID=UPI0021DF54C0|nr:ImcF-related family protein [Granulicella paludicola]